MEKKVAALFPPLPTNLSATAQVGKQKLFTLEVSFAIYGGIRKIECAGETFHTQKIIRRESVSYLPSRRSAANVDRHTILLKNNITLQELKAYK